MQDRSATSLELTSIAIGFAVVVISSLGCISSTEPKHVHEYSLTPDAAHRSTQENALLIPIDHTNDDPVKDLDVANERIARFIAEYFDGRGVVVQRIETKRFRDEVAAVQREMNLERKLGNPSSRSARVEFGDTLPDALSRLEVSADIVISANVVLRTATYTESRTISWDGVRRRGGAADYRLTGNTIQAASLYVEVHRRDGTRIFSGYGGLEPIVMFDSHSRRHVLRDDLFQDERNLREGICVAFYPYFGVDERCTR